MMKIDKDVMQWEFSYDLCIENEAGKCRIPLQNLQQVKVIQAEIDKIQGLVTALEEIMSRSELPKSEDDAHYENYYEAQQALAKYRGEVEK